MLKNIDVKYISITLLILVGSILFYLNSTIILFYIKVFISIKDLNLFVGGFATIVSIVYKIKNRKFDFRETMSFNEFRIPLEDILSYIGSPITLFFTISLIKGVYLQLYGEAVYFPFFNTVELTFFGLVAIYLIFISIMELYRQGKDICKKKNFANNPPTPIPEDEVRDIEPPEPE